MRWLEDRSKVKSEIYKRKTLLKVCKIYIYILREK